MKKNLPELLKAIDKLIEHYSKYEMNEVPPAYNPSEYCPLCIFLNVIECKCKLEETKETIGITCAVCPWIFFDKVYCMDAEYDMDTTAQRLDRLNRWKKRLQR